MSDISNWAPIRRALQNKVEETSLRKTARELEVSPTALTRFLEGTTPRSNGNRYTTWYLLNGQRWDTDAVLAAAIDVVLGAVPESRREEVRTYLTAVTASGLTAATTT